jgi:hypothetical protein
VNSNNKFYFQTWASLLARMVLVHSRLGYIHGSETLFKRIWYFEKNKMMEQSNSFVTFVRSAPTFAWWAMILNILSCAALLVVLAIFIYTTKLPTAKQIAWFNVRVALLAFSICCLGMVSFLAYYAMPVLHPGGFILVSLLVSVVFILNSVTWARTRENQKEFCTDVRFTLVASVVTNLMLLVIMVWIVAFYRNNASAYPLTNAVHDIISPSLSLTKALSPDTYVRVVADIDKTPLKGIATSYDAMMMDPLAMKDAEAYLSKSLDPTLKKQNG